MRVEKSGFFLKKIKQLQVVISTWQFKEKPNKAKQKPMQRLEANQLLNRAQKSYAQTGTAEQRGRELVRKSVLCPPILGH